MIRKIYRTIKIKIRRIYIKLTSKIRKNRITNTKFTIISNNCWGGFIYQSYGLKYTTPTLGLFFMADDYIKFVYEFDRYIKIDDIKEIKIENSKYRDFLEKVNYNGVIGMLDDIEIMFLHYKNINDAVKKWNSRKKRINRSNILFKFCDQNECEKHHIEKFLQLPEKNKICFVSKKYSDVNENNVFHIKSNEITATNEPIGASKVVNINNIINNMKK